MSLLLLLTSSGPAVGRTASSSGVGSSTATRVISNVRLASAGGLGAGTAIGTVTRVRTASQGAVGSSTANRLATRVRTASASGLGSSTATAIRTRVVGPVFGSALGSSSALVLVTRVRTANTSGVSSSVVVSGRLIERTGFSAAYVPDSLVLWANGGKALMEEVRMPPFWLDKKPRIVRRRM